MTQQEKQINYMGPFITMVFLFFIVGFLTTANTQFQGPLKETFLSEVGGLKNTFATLITFSWFLAYPVCGGVGSSWISKYGYKGTLMRGLLVMIVGLGLFFASSYFTVHFPEANWHAGNNVIPGGFLIFLLGSFVVGASATILQVVINPYLTACHVKGTQSIQRLAIGGSANSVGTTLAPYFVTGVVFGGLSMEDIQIDQLMVPFLALMAVISLIVLLLMKLSLPDIQGTRVEKGEKLEKSVWSFRHLTLGVVAIFFYVGVEVCIGANINLYAIEMDYASPALLRRHRTQRSLRYADDVRKYHYRKHKYRREQACTARQSEGALDTRHENGHSDQSVHHRRNAGKQTDGGAYHRGNARRRYLCYKYRRQQSERYAEHYRARRAVDARQDKRQDAELLRARAPCVAEKEIYDTHLTYRGYTGHDKIYADTEHECDCNEPAQQKYRVKQLFS